MSQLLEIKNAKELNAEDLSHLHSQCFDRGWDISEFQNYIENPIMQIWGAYHQKSLVGFLLLQVIEDEAEILTFCVSPEFQGQGIGKKILQEVIENIEESNGKEIILDVSKANSSARHIYTQLGFEPFAIREQYYTGKQGKNEDAVVMKLRIK